MRFFYRLFYRSFPCRPCLGDGLLEGMGGFGLHPGEDVLVGVDGERRVRMTQPL
jgi:hypothetical protein